MKMMSNVRLHMARECARSVIENMWIKTVEDIDLHEIAWRVGKLTISECSMKNCEGRLVTDGETGIIRVNKEIVHSGRQRFTISHEIGHFCLNHHKRNMFDSHYETNSWKNCGIETEANHFASELLMPCRLVQDAVAKATPQIKSIVQLSEVYQTSILATAIKFIELTNVPCILVCVGSNGKIKWHKKSGSYQIPFYKRRIHKNSLASYVLETGEDISFNEEVPKEIWLGHYNPCTSLKESAYYVKQTNEIISLLWAE